VKIGNLDNALEQSSAEAHLIIPVYCACKEYVQNDAIFAQNNDPLMV
jgi:hypothetical protein